MLNQMILLYLNQFLIELVSSVDRSISFSNKLVFMFDFIAENITTFPKFQNIASDLPLFLSSRKIVTLCPPNFPLVIISKQCSGHSSSIKLKMMHEKVIDNISNDNVINRY